MALTQWMIGKENFPSCFVRVVISEGEEGCVEKKRVITCSRQTRTRPNCKTGWEGSVGITRELMLFGSK